jgi:hypothetical protein
LYRSQQLATRRRRWITPSESRAYNPSHNGPAQQQQHEPTYNLRTVHLVAVFHQADEQTNSEESGQDKGREPCQYP